MAIKVVKCAFNRDLSEFISEPVTDFLSEVVPSKSFDALGKQGSRGNDG